MSTEKITHVLEAIRNDPKAQELLKETQRPEDFDSQIRIYANIAAQLGYDITETDLKEYILDVSKRTSDRTEDLASQITELPEETLEQVAGGKKHHINCKDTFESKENCWHTDGCDWIFNFYDDYVCHLLYQCGKNM